MYQFASLALIHCGATQVISPQDAIDPTNEQEFSKVQYTADKTISWSEYLQGVEEVKTKYGLKAIRFQRDKLLQETDWIMAYDNIDTLENKNDWIQYRQTLRNAPEVFTNYIWISFPSVLDLKAMGVPSKPPIIRKQ